MAWNPSKDHNEFVERFGFTNDKGEFVTREQMRTAVRRNVRQAVRAMGVTDGDGSKARTIGDDLLRDDGPFLRAHRHETLGSLGRAACDAAFDRLIQ